MPSGSLSLTSLPIATKSSLVQLVGSGSVDAELVEQRLVVDVRHRVGAHRDAVELAVDLAGGELVRVEVVEVELLADEVVEGGELLAARVFEDEAVVHLDDVGQVAARPPGWRASASSRSRRRSPAPTSVAGLLGCRGRSPRWCAGRGRGCPTRSAGPMSPACGEGADRGEGRGGRSAGQQAAELAPGQLRVMASSQGNGRQARVHRCGRLARRLRLRK